MMLSKISRSFQPASKYPTIVKTNPHFPIDPKRDDEKDMIQDRIHVHQGKIYNNIPMKEETIKKSQPTF